MFKLKSDWIKFLFKWKWYANCIHVSINKKIQEKSDDECFSRKYQKFNLTKANNSQLIELKHTETESTDVK